MQLSQLLKRRFSPRGAACKREDALQRLHNAPSPRLTTAQQWSALVGVLDGAITGATDARRRQSAATQQLDLAQYALFKLGDELAAVMSIPGRREPATLHVLEPAAVPAIKRRRRRRALAA